VKGILSDVNIQGYVDLLINLAQAEPWKLFWDDLNLRYVHFDDVGLDRDAPDTIVWETSQRQELILVTDNRNQDDEASLETMIRSFNTPTSLPVLTIANVPRLRSSREYADQIIERMIEFLMRIETVRGAGRLYLP
jgi:predicted nuclease of predicted toxin-antitoxin system